MARITNPAVLRFAARFGIHPGQPLTDSGPQAQQYRTGVLVKSPARVAAKPLTIPERPPAPNSTHMRGPRVFTQGATHAGQGYARGAIIRR